MHAAHEIRIVTIVDSITVTFVIGACSYLAPCSRHSGVGDGEGRSCGWTDDTRVHALSPFIIKCFIFLFGTVINKEIIKKITIHTHQLLWAC